MTLVYRRIVYLLLCTSSILIGKTYDLTVVGPAVFADSIGRQSIGLIDCLKNKKLATRLIPIPVWSSSPPWRIISSLNDIPAAIRAYVKPATHDKSWVTILEAMLTNRKQEHYKKIPPNSFIKIAYTMLESTAIPQEWVAILNNNFDAALVPDRFLVDVYKNSGVTIPIFVLPLGVYMHELLQLEPKPKSSKPFIFGNLAAFCERKNQLLLLEAFAEEFGNNPNFALVLNGRAGDEYYHQLLQRQKELSLTNVSITNNKLPWTDYVAKIASFHCGVNISKGEGFGVFGRELMAARRVCIIANNTAQQTMCATGLICSVESTIAELAYYAFCNQYCGFQFNCTKEALKSALRDAYSNYDRYLVEKVDKAREWVKQYRYRNLQNYFYTIVNPSYVIKGEHDSIQDDHLVISSPNLLAKYNQLIQDKKRIS